MDAGYFILGSVLFAVSINCFASPNNVAQGGVTGIAMIINYIAKLPIGMLVFAINIPLFIISAKAIGIRFLLKTLVATVMVSVALDAGALFMPAYEGDRLLAALFGGVLSGAGMALIFLRGATTGGIDIVARLLQKKYPHIPIGRMILFIDLIVALAAAAVFKSIESALYSIIMIYLCSIVLDKLLYDAVNGIMLLIVTDKAREISEEIGLKLVRGSTIVKAVGSYTNEDKNMLICAVRRNELYDIRAIIKNHDNKAFTMVTEAGEIIGEGFSGEE